MPKFKLSVPLDASGVADFKPNQAVKAVAVGAKGETTSVITQLDAKGHGTAVLEFAEKPGNLRILLGPDSATDEEMKGLQTIGVDVKARQLNAAEVKIAPIAISAFYWHWWPLWCRTFTITGRVVCPNGQPAPGATVCAYDVGFWWWWLSKNQVACTTTDASGSFKMQFRWCCGFYPWWWWNRRFWVYEPLLGDVIGGLLRRDPKIPIPRPRPEPDLGIFKQLLPRQTGGVNPLVPAAMQAATFAPAEGVAKFDPGTLAPLQEVLAKHLPAAPELEKFRLWPWFPWAPWLDCNPDIVFRVTQQCGQTNEVILDENIFQTRWNIPQDLNVSLTANQQACCVPPDNRPEGDCIVISSVCDILLNNIGGNPGAPAAAVTAGYASPGVAANLGDRPFAGDITISALFGHGAHADYYELEWKNGATFDPLPPSSAIGFTRYYWGPKLGGGPVGTYDAPFNVQSLSGRNVIESREHFEATNDPANWGVTRFWLINRDVLEIWRTSGIFNDNSYHLRVKSYPALGAGLDLAHARVLPLCDTKDDNSLVLTLDNRLENDPSHPTAPDHPCGGGTVHLCVTEPDTDIINVFINGAAVKACDFVDASKGGTLDIDFLAHDPDGHLESYSLVATYGENLAVDLLTAPGRVLTPGPVASGIGPAAQVGPDYQSARTLPQTAAAPIWNGGTVHLHIPNIRQVFTKTCCYQLELRAYKRTIVSCYGGSAHNNLSEYSFMVIV